MNSSYPIMLQLAGKKVMVVGGGKVAERKVSGLLNTGALISVISPDVTEELKKLASNGIIEWQEKAFSQDDLEEAFMIFAATNNKGLNQLIRQTAGGHQLVTIADDPEGSDFHVPSHFHRGRLSVAVSTGGASPILASQIRRKLEQEFDESYDEYLEFLFTARQRILQEVKDASAKRKLLTEIASPRFFESKDREKDFLRLFD